MVFMYTVNYVFAPGGQQRRFIDTIIFLPAHMFFSYTQMYLAIPVFLLKKKYRKYFLYTCLFLSISVAYSQFAGINWMKMYKIPMTLERYFHYKQFLISCGRTSFALFFTCGLAVAIKLFKEWFRQREHSLTVENEKVKLELESLRSQIHPHFLFNTLNNLYSLTLTSSGSASTVVAHLSELLRYMLYECKEPEVPVEKELQMLKKYIELEKLRYGSRLEIAFTLSGETKDLTIAPLLLLPFVENSFKHGVSDQIDQCWINIHVSVENTSFTLQVSNSRAGTGQNSFGGLGMENVRKRLRLLYPSTHSLKTIEEDEVYVIKLDQELNRGITEKSTDVNKRSEKTELTNAL